MSRPWLRPSTRPDFLGGLNVAMNCAGILGAGRVLGKRPDAAGRFQGTVMVSLVGSFNVAKAAANRMQHNDAGEDGERGVIINTASIAAYEGQIGQAAYAASKNGVVSMTLPMARELSRFGIRVNTIAPGVFWTPMVDGMPKPCSSRWPPRSRSRRGWASRKTSPAWSASSSATPTSTARPSAWTAPPASLEVIPRAPGRRI